MAGDVSVLEVDGTAASKWRALVVNARRETRNWRATTPIDLN